MEKFRVSTRIMPFADLTGRKVNTLTVGEMVSRNPKPRYRITCECGASTTEGHDRLMSGAAICRSTGHGKLDKRKDILTEQRSEATAREDARLAEQREASARRMEFETEGYQRPERYAPTPEPREMSERERISLREFHEAEEAAQREADRPRLEAERRAAEEQAEREQREKEKQERQRAYWKDAVLTASDPKLTFTPELATASMPTAKVETHNVTQVNQFIAETPEYGDFRTPQNATEIMAYLERNGLRIFDVPTLRAAFVRLRDLGILTKRVPSEPPKPAPAPVRVNLSSAPEPKRTTSPKPIDDGSETGVDWTTGRPLTLRAKQVAALSADDYRRFKKLDRAALELPQFPTNRYTR